MDGARGISPPVHVTGPEGPWREVHDGVRLRGNATVRATVPEWLPALRAAPSLRSLLGSDWPRHQRAPDATARHRFAVSRLVVKHTAAAVLGVGPADLELAYRLGGRPYLRGLDQIHLSLTHTGDLVAVGISRSGPIGVDAEPVDRRMPFELVASRLCTSAERHALARLGEREQQAALLRLWTLKEAYTKALGQGMRFGFTEFGFDPDGGGLLAPDGTPAARGEWSFATRSTPDRHLISVACHDTGLDASRDIAVATMLDAGFTDAVTELPGSGGPPAARAGRQGGLRPLEPSSCAGSFHGERPTGTSPGRLPQHPPGRNTTVCAAPEAGRTPTTAAGGPWWPPLRAEEDHVQDIRQDMRAEQPRPRPRTTPTAPATEPVVAPPLLLAGADEDGTVEPHIVRGID